MANIKISDTIISNSDKILKKLETYGISYDNFILSSVAGVFNIPYFMIKQENWYRIDPSDSDEVKLQKRKAAFAFICDKAFSSIDTNLYNKLSGTESQTYAEWESLVGTKIPKLLAKCIYSELNTRLSSNANPESINSGIATGSSINVSSPTFSMIISVDSIFSNDAKTLIADLQQEFETIFDTTNISPDVYAFKTLLNVAITFLVNKLNGALVSSNQSIDITFLPDRIDFVSKVEGVKFDEESIVFDPNKNVWKVGKVEISNITGLVQALSLKANSNEVVNLTGDQTVSGTKTFNNHIKAPDGVSFNDVVTKKQLDDISASLVDYIKYTSLDTKAFTQIGGMISLKVSPSGRLLLQSDGLAVDSTKVAISQIGVTQLIQANWNYDAQMDFRVNLPLSNNKFTGEPLTPTLPGHLINKGYADNTYAKKELSNVDTLVREAGITLTNNNGANLVINKWTLTAGQDPLIMFKELVDFPQDYFLEIDINQGDGLGTFPKFIVSEDLKPTQPNNYVMNYSSSNDGGYGKIILTCGKLGATVQPLNGTLVGSIVGTYQDQGNIVHHFQEVSSNISFDFSMKQFSFLINGYSRNTSTNEYKNVLIIQNASPDPNARPEVFNTKYRIWKKAKVS